jgi:integrase
MTTAALERTGRAVVLGTWGCAVITMAASAASAAVAYDSLHTYGLAPSTVRGVVAVVSSVFASAVTDELIARNPCSGLVLPEMSQAPVLIPTNEQMTSIVAAVRAPWYRRMVLVAAGSGLRAGELRGLTEDRVDWLRGKIKVDRQLAERELIWGPPKSKAGYRTVRVAQSVIDLMAQQIAERGLGPGGLIFTNRTGGFVKHRRSTRRWPECSTLSAGRPGPGSICSGTTTRAS